MSAQREESPEMDSARIESHPRYLALFGVYLLVIPFLFLVMSQLHVFISGAMEPSTRHVMDIAVGIPLMEVGILLLPFALKPPTSKSLRTRIGLLGFVAAALSPLMVIVPFPDPNLAVLIFILMVMAGLVLMEVAALLSWPAFRTMTSKSLAYGTALLGLIVAATAIIPPPSYYSSIVMVKFIIAPVGLLLMLVGLSSLLGNRSKRV